MFQLSMMPCESSTQRAQSVTALASRENCRSNDTSGSLIASLILAYPGSASPSSYLGGPLSTGNIESVNDLLTVGLDQIRQVTGPDPTSFLGVLVINANRGNRPK